MGKKDNSLLISNYLFETNKKSTYSIIFINGKHDSNNQIQDCIFIRKYSNGYNYIDEKVLLKDKLKIHVNSCKFSSESYSDYISIDHYNDKKDVNKRWNMTLLLSSFLAILFLIIGIMIKKLFKNEKLINDSDTNTTTIEDNKIVDMTSERLYKDFENPN